MMVDRGAIGITAVRWRSWKASMVPPPLLGNCQYSLLQSAAPTQEQHRSACNQLRVCFFAVCTKQICPRIHKPSKNAIHILSYPTLSNAIKLMHQLWALFSSIVFMVFVRIAYFAYWITLHGNVIFDILWPKPFPNKNIAYMGPTVRQLICTDFCCWMQPKSILSNVNQVKLDFDICNRGGCLCDIEWCNRGCLSILTTAAYQ